MACGWALCILCAGWGASHFHRLPKLECHATDFHIPHCPKRPRQGPQAPGRPQGLPALSSPPETLEPPGQTSWPCQAQNSSCGLSPKSQEDELLTLRCTCPERSAATATTPVRLKTWFDKASGCRSIRRKAADTGYWLLACAVLPGSLRSARRHRRSRQSGGLRSIWDTKAAACESEHPLQLLVSCDVS